MSGDILVLNAGSSSIKAAVFDARLTLRVTALADGIGGPGALRIGESRRSEQLPDHDAALCALLNGLAQQGHGPETLRAAGHRVVHGGDRLTVPARLTPEVIDRIRASIPLAPLHNPHHLAGILALSRRAPDLDQCASFDTAFHASNPPVASHYALPPEITARGLRRYGFHGISYTSLCRELPRLSGAALPERLLACHLGNGVSLCAIRDGLSLATTMGYTPLEGTTMGTRSGSVDPNAVLDLAERDGIAATRRLLNHESGLKGLSGGISDMRALLSDPSPQAGFAVEHFVYWILRHAGSMIAAMEGIDAIAFTGGIGEHAAPVRDRILSGLRWTGLRPRSGAVAPMLHAAGSPVTAWVVPAAEERQIASDTMQLLGPA